MKKIFKSEEKCWKCEREEIVAVSANFQFLLVMPSEADGIFFIYFLIFFGCDDDVDDDWVDDDFQNQKTTNKNL